MGVGDGEVGDSPFEQATAAARTSTQNSRRMRSCLSNVDSVGVALKKGAHNSPDAALCETGWNGFLKTSQTFSASTTKNCLIQVKSGTSATMRWEER